ncbi:MAG: tRNA pseudouridine(38-40) synthase TruA [Methanolinea sp.]|nr:tRNA pseudouridine(38-40) synthase TruA [Methanolinea sp.]
MEEDLAQDHPEVTRLAFRCGYLGDRFAGSQVQPDARTVEGEFIAACLRLSLFSDPRTARFQAAGRTDRGVHARCQVFALSTPLPGRATSLIRYHLPRDLWVTGYAQVDPGFHPRHRALHRTYRYFFGEEDLDTCAMDLAARSFEGTHDFTLFSRPDGRDPIRRVLSARVFEESGAAVLEVRAESFLWHMVRYMASALRLVGAGEAGTDLVASRLRGDPSARLSPAPPEGLVLWDVEYGFPFLPLGPGKKALSLLREEYSSARVRARVTASLLADAGVPRGEAPRGELP